MGTLSEELSTRFESVLDTHPAASPDARTVVAVAVDGSRMIGEKFRDIADKQPNDESEDLGAQEYRDLNAARHRLHAILDYARTLIVTDWHGRASKTSDAKQIAATLQIIDDLPTLAANELSKPGPAHLKCNHLAHLYADAARRLEAINSEHEPSVFVEEATLFASRQAKDAARAYAECNASSTHPMISVDGGMTKYTHRLEAIAVYLRQIGEDH